MVDAAFSIGRSNLRSWEGVYKLNLGLQGRGVTSFVAAQHFAAMGSKPNQFDRFRRRADILQCPAKRKDRHAAVSRNRRCSTSGYERTALRLPIAGKAEAGKAKRIIAQIEASGMIAVTEIRSVVGQFGCSIQDVSSSGPFLRNTRLRGGSLDQDT